MTGIIPVNITLMDWAQQLTDSYPEQNIPRLSSENAWQDWGNSLRLLQIFSGSNVPMTQQFVDWREWASEFLFSVGG